MCGSLENVIVIDVIPTRYKPTGGQACGLLLLWKSMEHPLLSLVCPGYAQLFAPCLNNYFILSFFNCGI